MPALKCRRAIKQNAPGPLGLAVASAVLAMAGCDDRPMTGAAPLNVLRVFGEVGQSPGQFIFPRAIDSDGETLWVIDKAARVQRIDPATGDPLGGWTMPDSAVGKPVGLTVAPWTDGSQCLWVPDTHYHRVMVYRPPAVKGGAAELVHQFGSYGREPGQFINPTDVAVLAGADGRPERIFVGEYGGNDRINIFDGQCTFVGSFGRLGSGDDPGDIQFDRPQSIAIEPAMRELVVVDSSNHRIGRFTLDGALVAWIGSPATAGTELGQFRYPYGLYLPGDGTALISEFGNNRVQQIDLKTGAGLGAWGRGGRGEGEVVTPWGITAIGSTAYILDSGNNRVIGFPAPRPRRMGGGSG
jgi:iron(III) transport system ATP-binding protein